MHCSSSCLLHPMLLGTLRHRRLQAHKYVAFGTDIFTYPELAKQMFPYLWSVFVESLVPVNLQWRNIVLQGISAYCEQCQIVHINKCRCHRELTKFTRIVFISILKNNSIAPTTALWHTSEVPFQFPHPKLQKLCFDIQWLQLSELYVFCVAISWTAVWNASD